MGKACGCLGRSIRRPLSATPRGGLTAWWHLSALLAPLSLQALPHVLRDQGLESVRVIIFFVQNFQWLCCCLSDVLQLAFKAFYRILCTLNLPATHHPLHFPGFLTSQREPLTAPFACPGVSLSCCSSTRMSLCTYKLGPSLNAQTDASSSAKPSQDLQ